MAWCYIVVRPVDQPPKRFVCRTSSGLSNLESKHPRLASAEMTNRDIQRTPDEMADLNRVALRLEYGTIGWNVGEAFLTIGLGAVASSLALIGFGTVSIVEVFASGVVVWHLLPGHGASTPERTARAHRLVAVAFGALAVALTFAGVRDLVTGRIPDESPWGIAYLAMTAVVMFSLAAAKRRIATQLDSSPLHSEASMTFLDGVLSTAIMFGLLLNAVAGWWWADPTAALLVGLAAAREAKENWSEAATQGEL